jgi:hypothetical protein
MSIAGEGFSEAVRMQYPDKLGFYDNFAGMTES